MIARVSACQARGEGPGLWEADGGTVHEVRLHLPGGAAGAQRGVGPVDFVGEAHVPTSS